MACRHRVARGQRPLSPSRGRGTPQLSYHPTSHHRRRRRPAPNHKSRRTPLRSAAGRQAPAPPPPARLHLRIRSPAGSVQSVYLIILTFSYGVGSVMPPPFLKLFGIHCLNQCSEVLSNSQKWMDPSLKILLLEAHPRNLADVRVVGVLKSQLDSIL